MAPGTESSYVVLWKCTLFVKAITIFLQKPEEMEPRFVHQNGPGSTFPGSFTDLGMQKPASLWGPCLFFLDVTQLTTQAPDLKAVAWVADLTSGDYVDKG